MKASTASVVLLLSLLTSCESPRQYTVWTPIHEPPTKRAGAEHGNLRYSRFDLEWNRKVGTVWYPPVHHSINLGAPKSLTKVDDFCYRATGSEGSCLVYLNRTTGKIETR